MYMYDMIVMCDMLWCILHIHVYIIQRAYGSVQCVHMYMYMYNIICMYIHVHVPLPSALPPPPLPPPPPPH